MDSENNVSFQRSFKKRNSQHLDSEDITSCSLQSVNSQSYNSLSGFNPASLLERHPYQPYRRNTVEYIFRSAPNNALPFELSETDRPTHLPRLDTPGIYPNQLSFMPNGQDMFASPREILHRYKRRSAYVPPTTQSNSHLHTTFYANTDNFNNFNSLDQILAEPFQEDDPLVAFMNSNNQNCNLQSLNNNNNNNFLSNIETYDNCKEASIAATERDNGIHTVSDITNLQINFGNARNVEHIQVLPDLLNQSLEYNSSLINRTPAVTWNTASDLNIKADSLLGMKTEKEEMQSKTESDCDECESRSEGEGEGENIRKGVWSVAEDNILLAHSDLARQKNWSTLAQYIPDRTAKQCRERWCYNLNPDINRTDWTFDEDTALLQLQQVHGNKWALIAKELQRLNRTENSIKTRYKSLVRAQLKEWKPEEDHLIVTLYKDPAYGCKWLSIAQAISHSLNSKRSKHAVKMRFKVLQSGLENQTPPLPGEAKSTIRRLLYPPERLRAISESYKAQLNTTINTGAQFAFAKQTLLKTEGMPSEPQTFSPTYFRRSDETEDVQPNGGRFFTRNSPYDLNIDNYGNGR